MRIPHVLTATAIAFTIGACSGNPDTNTNVTTDVNLAEDAALNDVLGANALGEIEAEPVNPTDAQGFATAVAASDLFEMESGKIAQEKATSADLKAFARQLVTDHRRSTAQLTAAASEAEPAVTVSPALDAEKQRMLDELKAATGADFDRRFIDQQTVAHQKALGLLENYATGGDRKPLRDFAGEASKAVKRHMDHVNGIKN